MYHQFYTIDVIERDMRALLDLIDDSNIVDANERVPIEICAWSLAIALEEHERPIWGFMCQDVTTQSNTHGEPSSLHQPDC